MTAPVSVPFDHVTIQTARGVTRLTVAEFMALSLRQRVRHILDDQLDFYLGDDKVERAVAMHALMVGALDPRPRTNA